MSTDAIAVIGFVSLFGLMLLRVPVGMAMGLVAVSGLGYIVGGEPALKYVGHTSMRTVTDYNFAVVPLFLLMGAFASTSGMSRVPRWSGFSRVTLPRSPARSSAPTSSRWTG